MIRTIGSTLVALSVCATGLRANELTQVRCKPDWTREGATNSDARNAYHGDPFAPLKSSGIRANPEELVRVVMSDADLLLRLTALQAIAECNFDETVDELEAHLVAPEAEKLREPLTVLLLRWGSSKARAHVRSIVTNPSSGTGVRLAWYPQHLLHGGEADLDFLRAAVDSEDANLRAASAPAVASLLVRPEYAMEGKRLLRELLADSETNVRGRARQGLYEMAARETRAELCVLMEEVVEEEQDANLRGTAGSQLLVLRAMGRCDRSER